MYNIFKDLDEEVQVAIERLNSKIKEYENWSIKNAVTIDVSTKIRSAAYLFTRIDKQAILDTKGLFMIYRTFVFGLQTEEGKVIPFAFRVDYNEYDEGTEFSWSKNELADEDFINLLKQLFQVSEQNKLGKLPESLSYLCESHTFLLQKNEFGNSIRNRCETITGIKSEIEAGLTEYKVSWSA